MKPINFKKRHETAPYIYVYELPDLTTHTGQVKIGYTERKTIQQRIHEQVRIFGDIKYNILLETSAVKNDGSNFNDHHIHQILRHNGFINTKNEWFKCTVDDVKKAIDAIRNNKTTITDRIYDFKMRPEQSAAVAKAEQYFKSIKSEKKNTIPHFLWNAKMRFGKTFTAYQLAKKMGWKKVLVLTFKPAVHNAWQDDLNTHKDFDGWQFVSKKTPIDMFNNVNWDKPVVCFGSFQDYLGRGKNKSIKPENEWVHTKHWDCIIFDEYHYGAWRDKAKELVDANEKVMGEEYITENGTMDIPITTDHYLYLSGTPFRAIATGEFIEEQIYNWTYSNEQNAKFKWDNKNGDNPYASLPNMVMMTYKLPEHITDIARGGEFNEFDLNAFFATESEKGHEKDAQFTHKQEVQKWLDIMRGGGAGQTLHTLKTEKPYMPFSDINLRQILSHTFWLLPDVASCHAMANLLHEPQNTFYHDYEIIVCAGASAGIGAEALKPVQKAMDNPFDNKTITLSCGKLTTGVSVKPWVGILMLCNIASPETYFQSAFRVQTPWAIDNPDGNSPNKTAIIKEQCFVFDFSPNRALRLVNDYACNLNIDNISPEKKAQDFINFLPILAYDGSYTAEINAKAVLDMAMSGTTATLLAKRWNSPILVNVDTITLQRLMDNPKAMEALSKIEEFRNLRQDIRIIISKSEKIKNLKKENNEKGLNKSKKKKLTDEQREYKKKQIEIQKKLRRIAMRIPVFMYLTDEREETLQDVIKQLETNLFKKVTGLSISDFELLESLGVFNGAEMNSAVFKFRRYEDSSIGYVGNNQKTQKRIGLYNTVISSSDFIE